MALITTTTWEGKTMAGRTPTPEPAQQPAPQPAEGTDPGGSTVSTERTTNIDTGGGDVVIETGQGGAAKQEWERNTEIDWESWSAQNYGHVQGESGGE